MVGILHGQGKTLGGKGGCSAPNDQKRRFCLAIFLAPRKNPGNFISVALSLLLFAPAKHYVEIN